MAVSPLLYLCLRCDHTLVKSYEVGRAGSSVLGKLWRSRNSSMQHLKVKVLLAQLCPTLFNPMDCSPPRYRMQCLSIIYTQIPVQSVIRKQPMLWILLNCLNLKGMLVCPPLVSNSCHYWDSHLRSSGFCGLFWDCLKKRKKIFFNYSG